MREKTIKVVLVEPGKAPRTEEVKNKFGALGKLVGGLMDCVHLEDAILVCNDEGKINGMEPNRRVGNDIICGPFFICGDGVEDFCSLTNEQIAKYSILFSEPEQFTGEEIELEPRINFISFN